VEGRLRQGEEGWQARYRIERGPPTRIVRLDLRITGPGAEDSDLQRIVRESGLAEGARLDHSAYKNTRQQLIERAVELGYLEARFPRHRIEVDPRANQATVALVLETGPAYFFGEVGVEQEVLDPDFAEEFVPVAPGQPLTSDRLLDLQFALSDSGYFRQVEVDVLKAQAVPFRPGPDRPPQAGRKVPVTVHTSPRPVRHYRIGVGYGTDTGPRLTSGVEFRRLNRWGHRGRLDLLLSPVKRNFATQYIIPIRNVRTDRMTFSASRNVEERGDGFSTQNTIGISRDILWHSWRRNLYAQFSLERSEFSGETNRSMLLTPGIDLSKTVADDPLYPRRGWSLFLDLHGAHEGFLADTTFTQVRGNGRAVLPLGGRMRLLGRVAAGYTILDQFSRLPASERFFTGGDRSVRGYPYQSLGPRNDEGEVVGGEHVLVFSGEAEVRVWGNWGIAGFYDAGNASNDWPPDPVAGAGAGLRWASPIGMIRLDYARPLSDRRGDWRIHFSMGPDL
jgi:translocation and assembly module TamA